MATVKVRFTVFELDNVLTQFDQVMVFRSDAREGTYTEITGIGTRVNLVAGTTEYEFIDTTAPDNTYWYRTAYYNSATLLQSSMSDPIQGSDAGLYVSLQDIRDEGITTSELSDERAMILIRGWQAWFERATGQFFTIKTESAYFDGDGSRLLQLPVPIITCTALYTNDDFDNALDTSEYVVYNARGPINDDRKNPRIKLKRSSSLSSNIFSTSGNSSIFEMGDQNIRVDGTWGYVESDGTTPTPVSRAVMILVLATKELLGDDDIDQLKVGRVIEEVTDRHRIEYADLYNRLKTWAPTGITEVDLAIQMYRAPMRVDAPRNIGLIV